MHWPGAPQESSSKLPCLSTFTGLVQVSTGRPIRHRTRLALADEAAAVRSVVVDSIDETAARFYARWVYSQPDRRRNRPAACGRAHKPASVVATAPTDAGWPGRNEDQRFWCAACSAS